MTPDDAAILHMLAGAHFGPEAELTLPSGEVLGPDEANALTAAYEVDCCGHTTPGLLGTRLLFCTEPTGHEGDHRDDSGCSWSEIPRHSDSGRWHIIGTGDRVFESPCDCPKPVSWWRRMFGGGS